MTRFSGTLGAVVLLLFSFSTCRGQGATANGIGTSNLEFIPVLDDCEEYLGKPLQDTYRRIDGSCNSKHFPGWGSTARGQSRWIPVTSDGMTGTDRPEPRIVSNAIFEEGDAGGPVSTSRLSEATIYFGQFLGTFHLRLRFRELDMSLLIF